MKGERPGQREARLLSAEKTRDLFDDPREVHPVPFRQREYHPSGFSERRSLGSGQPVISPGRYERHGRASPN